jgi:hypothetical protein
MMRLADGKGSGAPIGRLYGDEDVDELLVTALG